jgi:hypothetical protein
LESNHLEKVRMCVSDTGYEDMTLRRLLPEGWLSLVAMYDESWVTFAFGRAIAQAVSHRLPTLVAPVRSQNMWDLWWTVAVGQVFSDYFGFHCQFTFHRLLHIHHHLSSGAGTKDQLVADVPSGLNLTPPKKKTFA